MSILSILGGDEMLFYVGSYRDDVKGHIFVGWSKNRFAVESYNVAGHKGGAFYDHYEIFEYENDNENNFSQIIMNEWGINAVDFKMNKITMYDTTWGDYISLSKREYVDLIESTDVDFEVIHIAIQNLSEFIKNTEQEVIRNKDIVCFVGYIADKYLNILKTLESDPTYIEKCIDKIQAFIYKHGEIFNLENVG